MADETKKELLTGSQLVVRMQYDDAIKVSPCHLDDLLDTIVKNLRSHSLYEYGVTLGARVNPKGTQNIEVDDDGCSSQSPATDTPQAACHSKSAGCGITALTSSPTENYSYYAKTVLTTESKPCLTILIEIFVNEKIDLSKDKDKQTKIIESVTEAINTCIIKKQTPAAAVRICVLNFVSNPKEDSKCDK